MYFYLKRSLTVETVVKPLCMSVYMIFNITL